MGMGGEAKRRKMMATKLWKVWLSRRERESLTRIVRAAKAQNSEEMERNIDAMEALEADDEFQADRGLMTQEDAIKWQLNHEEWISKGGDEGITMTVADARTIVKLYADAVSARQITTQTGAQVRRAVKRLKRVDDNDAKGGEAEPVMTDEEVEAQN